MINEEKARQKARCYDTEYAEDFTMADMLSRPQDFNKEGIKYVYLCLKEKHYRDGYIDGLAEGKPEWHDLRKNPDDLPKNKGEYWTKYNDLNEERGGYYDIHYFDPNNPFYKQKWYKLDVIAWCELPKFEEDNRGK